MILLKLFKKLQNCIKSMGKGGSRGVGEREKEEGRKKERRQGNEKEKEKKKKG